MTRKELDNFVGDADSSVQAEFPDWDGTCTSVPMARTIMRDQRLVAPGEKIVFKCCKSDGGEWVGPEAEHLQDLISLGVVDGTNEKLARDQKQAAVEYARGVNAPLVMKDGLVESGPRPEFREQTHKDIQKLYKDLVRGGPEEMMRREKQEARAEQTTVKELAAAIKDAVGAAPEPAK